MQSDFTQVYAPHLYSTNKLEVITASSFLSNLYPSFDIHNQNRCNLYESRLSEKQTKFEWICNIMFLNGSKINLEYATNWYE